MSLDDRTGFWRVRFYWNRVQHYRSCHTKNKKVAIRTLAVVEETLEELKRGRVVIPDELPTRLQADWIVGGGKLTNGAAAEANGQSNGKPASGERGEQFGVICGMYLADQAQKQPTTIGGEKVHINHLKRILKAKTPLEEMDLDSLRRYKRRRKRDEHHGKPPSEATIKKELVTFRQIWMWAKNNEYVSSQCPLVTDTGRWKIEFEKPADRGKFRTWSEIERRIKRGGLDEEDIDELWRGLFLDQSQVCELLAFVKENARYDFIYPMFCFAAYTGARRSEILRSHIDDFDFDTNQVFIRERKRKKDKSNSTRQVPLHPRLYETMKSWFDVHPGGQYTIQPPKKMPRRKALTEMAGLTVHQAHRHFEGTLADSKWGVVSGFHVLRHSFGSNVVRSGKVPPEVVARWMGHTTEEMKSLYQHLFPQDGINQINVLE